MSLDYRCVNARLALLAGVASFAVMSEAALADPLSSFTAGDLVVDSVGVNPDAPNGSTYLLDQASPMTLLQYSVSGTSSAAAAGYMTLPQTNAYGTAISGEYESASEGMLQLSGDGHYLTVMGYGTGAAQYNASQDPNGTGIALGQSTSTSVPRVVALIGANGGVNTSTILSNVYSQNNPRSAYTENGTSFYISGQGAKGSSDQGIYYATLGANTATPILNNSGDTRDVQVVNGKLIYSQDYNPPGSGGQQAWVASLTNGTSSPPTNSSNLTNTVLTPSGNNSSSSLNNPNKDGNAYYTTYPGSSPAIFLNSNGSNGNSVNSARDGNFVYASPEQFFFANSTTLYVTDSGSPKNGNAEKAALGDGGLQKYSLVNGLWQLDYTLNLGLDLVNNDPAKVTGTGPEDAEGDGMNDDVTGLFGLTGAVEMINGQAVVELFATSYTKNEDDTTYLYGITDTLADMTAAQAAGESFTTLETSAPDEEFRGVAFAPTGPSPLTPVPEPGPLAVIGAAFAGMLFVRRRRA